MDAERQTALHTGLGRNVELTALGATLPERGAAGAKSRELLPQLARRGVGGARAKDIPRGLRVMLSLGSPPANDTWSTSCVAWPEETKFELKTGLAVPTPWFNESNAFRVKAD